MKNSDLDDHRLLAFLLGELPAKEAESVRHAVGVQDDAKKRVAVLQQLLDTLGSARALDESFQLDKAQLAPLYNLAPTKKTSILQELGHAAEVIVALLLSDSKRQPLPAFGFRGAATCRRLELDADGRPITLSLTPRQGAIPGRTVGEVEVLGRVDGVSPGAAVDLVQAGSDSRRETTVDSDGFFNVVISCGTYTLVIKTGNSVIILPAIELD